MDKILIVKEILKNVSPIFFRKTVRESLKKYRKIRNFIDLQIFSKGLTEKDIVMSLERGGVKKGDVLLVHSSLSRLGHVYGGAGTVVEALLKTVGPKGTIGAPTFWGNTANYQKGNRVFDVKNSSTVLGKIAEIIRLHPQAKRSMHPTHSAAFIGPLADYLTKDHHLDNTPVGSRSPYLKLTQVGGKILLLGVTVEYLTNFHTIEDVVPNFPIRVYLPEPISFTVIDTEGNEFEVSTFYHCPEKAKLRQGSKMVSYLRKNNVFSEFDIGRGIAKLIDAKKFHDTLLTLCARGITMYKPTNL
jgi:aminoglycoside 3-N-acetyltransferase